jgi:hypothetical protein
LESEQLKDLMQEKPNAKGNSICIFNARGLNDAEFAVQHCNNVFGEVREELNKASKELTARKDQRGPIRLSAAERAKWPFLQPRMDVMRADLRDAKDTLLLMLSVATLAHAEKVALRYAISIRPYSARC